VSVLSNAEIDESLKTLDEWERDGDRIRREYSVDDFVQAVELVNAFVEPAEDHHHHPDLEVSWGSVVVNLTTHDAGGLTEKDFTLAETFDQIFEEGFS
jgi:4a-hydroxytetrahydrobiopterin dehydratase